MGCDINFTVKGKVFSYKNTPIVAESSLSDIAQYIINNPDIAFAIREQLKKDSSTPVINQLTGLVSNYTANILASRYPWMDWNENALGNKILGLNNYILKDNYGKIVEGPRVLSDGTIVVNINKPGDVQIVCNYLNRKYKLENISTETEDILKRYQFLEEFFKEKQKQLKEQLKELQSLQEDSPKKQFLEKLPFSLIDVNPDINSILLDFIQNSDAYKGLFIKDESFYKILQTAGSELDETYIHQYGDSLTDELNIRIKNKSSKPYILFSDLIQVLENVRDGSNEFKKLNKDEKMKYLMSLFNDTSIDFSYKPISIIKNRIYLQSEVRSFINQYDDFDIKTFRNLTPVEVDGNFDYRGYHIYKWKDKYIYSKGIISEFSYASKLYDSIQEIQKQIDYKYKNPIDSYYHFRQVNGNIVYSPYKYTPGTIIEVIDSSSLNLSRIKYGEVEDLFFNINTKFSVIQNYLYDKYGISKSTFNTPEKALLFLHYIIQNPTARVQNVVNIINNLPKKYYYVEYSKFISSSNFGNKYFRTLDTDSETRKKGARIDAKMYQTRVFEVDMNQDLDQYTPKYDGNQLLVTKRILTNLADLLSSKFGTKIEVLTFDEINDKFPDLKLTSSTKAFVRNGIIYINSSAATSEDVFHEYAHIFLGVLKSVNYDLYEQLMELMGTQDKKQQIKEAYKDLADQDINEEVFAFYFGKHLASSKVPNNLENELEQARKLIAEGMQSIFNKGITDNSLFDGNIWQTMKNFTSNILLLVEENNGLLIGSDTSKYRKASNWISKQLSEGNIIEEC